MRLTLGICGLLTAIHLSNCGSPKRPDHQPGASTSTPLLTFASDTSEARLLLRTDSTFTLTVPPANQAPPRVVTGRLHVADGHYRLFFADTLAEFNTLLTAVHADASVVAYPDYSVVLDKRLRQLYVNGILVTVTAD